MTGAPGWAWAVAGCVILGLLAIDLAVNKGQPGMWRALLVSAGWVATAAAFGIVLIAWQGGGAGQEYFAAYLVEKALSIDNVFVFALLFQAFAVPGAVQHRVLFAGVLGALALRWLHFSRCRTARSPQLGRLPLRGAPGCRGAADGAWGRARRLAGQPCPAWLRKVVPVGQDYHGTRFLVRRDGKLSRHPCLRFWWSSRRRT